VFKKQFVHIRNAHGKVDTKVSGRQRLLSKSMKIDDEESDSEPDSGKGSAEEAVMPAPKLKRKAKITPKIAPPSASCWAECGIADRTDFAS